MDCLKFHPRLDHDFYEEDPVELLHTAPAKPTVMGVTEKEAIFFSL
jgi:hypothetical protein